MERLHPAGLAGMVWNVDVDVTGAWKTRMGVGARKGQA